MKQRTNIVSQEIKAVGFDLGETLLFYPGVSLSWTKHYSEALAAVAAACGVSMTDEHLLAGSNILSRFNTRENPREHEVKSDEIFRGILSVWRLDPSLHLERATAAFFTYFQRDARPYDETLDVLQALRGREIPIGVLTDVPYGMPNDFVDRELNSAGLTGVFSAVVTSADAGYRKPHRAPFELLSEKLGLEPSKILFVGNESKDITGAKSIGMTAALVNREGAPLHFGQDATLPNLRELLRNFV